MHFIGAAPCKASGSSYGKFKHPCREGIACAMKTVDFSLFLHPKPGWKVKANVSRGSGDT